MRRATQGGRIRITSQKMFATLRALRPIIIKPHEQIRIFHLDRGMEQIADDHRIILLRPQGHGKMINGVAGGWQQPDMVIDRACTVDQIRAAQIHNRQDAINDMVDLLGAAARLPIGIFLFRNRYRAFGKVGTQTPFSSRVFQPT